MPEVTPAGQDPERGWLPRPPALAPPSLGGAELARFGALLGPRLARPGRSNAAGYCSSADRGPLAGVIPDEERDPAEDDQGADRDGGNATAVEGAAAPRRGRPDRTDPRRGGRGRDAHRGLWDPRAERLGRER